VLDGGQCRNYLFVANQEIGLNSRFLKLWYDSACARHSRSFHPHRGYLGPTFDTRGIRSVVAESVLLRHQLPILNRGRKRSPNLRVYDRIIAGFCTFLLGSTRVLKSAIVLKPSTLLRFHKMLVQRKYRALFSPKRRRQPGPKGPAQELIDAVVEMKRRNPTWGCRRIAQQVSLAFGVEIDKDIVRRILAVHFRPEPGSSGPSRLTFLGHTKDSLWSVDLFRLESLTLQTHWVLVVMDQFTRRIIGFGIHRELLDGTVLCRSHPERAFHCAPARIFQSFGLWRR